MERTGRQDGDVVHDRNVLRPEGLLFLDVDRLRLEQLLRNDRGDECGEDDHGHQLGVLGTGDEAVCVTEECRDRSEREARSP